MKYITLIFLTAFLISCGGSSPSPETSTDTDDVPIEDISNWSFKDIASVVRTFDGGEYYYPDRIFTVGLTPVIDKQGEANLFWGDDRGLVVAYKVDDEWVTQVVTTINKTQHPSSYSPPQVVTNPDGGSFLLWEDDRGVMTVYLVEGKWVTKLIAPVEKTYTGPRYYKHLQMAANENGNRIIFWEDDRGLMSVYSADGYEWTDVSKVYYGGRENRATKMTKFYDIGIDDQGNAMVIWSYDSNYYDHQSEFNIQSRRYVKNLGWGDVEETQIEIHYLSTPNSIQSIRHSAEFIYDKNGNLMLFMPFNEDADYEARAAVIVKTYTPGIGWGSPSKALPTWWHAYKANTDVDNNIIVVWEEDSSETTHIKVNNFNFNSGWGNEETIPLPSSSNEFPYPGLDRLVTNENGNVVVEWHTRDGIEVGSTAPPEIFNRTFKESTGWSVTEKIPYTKRLSDAVLYVSVGNNGELVGGELFSIYTLRIEKSIGKSKGAGSLPTYFATNGPKIGKIYDQISGDYQFWVSHYNVENGWQLARKLLFNFSDSSIAGGSEIAEINNENGFTWFWIDYLTDGTSLLRSMRYQK